MQRESAVRRRRRLLLGDSSMVCEAVFAEDYTENVVTRLCCSAEHGRVEARWLYPEFIELDVQSQSPKIVVSGLKRTFTT